MYDNIKMSINYNDHIKHIPSIMSYYVHNADISTGHIGNMRLYQDRKKGILIIEGSLAKFLNDENYTPLTIISFKQAVNILENAMGIDLSNADVMGFEFGVLIAVEHPVNNYLRIFGYLSGRYSDYEFTKDDKSKVGSLESKRYSNKVGGFAFQIYDKWKEMKDKRMIHLIPESFRDKNSMRLELKVKNKRGIVN